MSATILHRDYETRSTLDLKKVGACKYATHPTTDVWCCAYAVDDGPVMLWVPGDPVPEVFVEAANNPDWVVSAFNNRFERAIEQHIMAQRYDFPLVPLERHRCTQAAALSLALPFSLEAVAKALGVAEKDEVGRQLMLKMAKPRKPKKGEDEAKTYWLDDADRRVRLYEYCKQDVVVERAIHARVGHLSESEQEIWRLDQIVNDRGVYVDAEFIDAAIVCGEKSKAAVNAELAQITGGMINSAHQDEKIKAWVEACGVEIEDVQKPTVEEILTRENLPEKARRVLELRLEGAHAAAAKYKTMKAWRCPDGRVRGTLDYHGASTGRWSSHGIQLQNLKREAVVTADTIARILAGEASLKEIGDAVRYAICAAPGATLFSVDYSGVESRYTAWIAGEQKKLAQWARFDATGKAEDEPYFQIGKLFGFSDADARAGGKTADIAFGYMGGVGAYRRLAPPGDTLSDDEIKRLQKAWRQMHPNIGQLWKTLDNSAVYAVADPGKHIRANARVGFICEGDFLFMTLPSGRRLAYPFPRLITDQYDHSRVVFKDNEHGKWVDCRKGEGAYGGIWIENLVQGISRDVMAAAMARAEANGFPVVLTVHDQIVCEVPA